MISRDEAHRLVEQANTQFEDDHQVYEYVLNECNALIEQSASERKYYCIYTVPPMIFGLPAYDPEFIVRKLSSDLEQRKYDFFALTDHHRIFISWFPRPVTIAFNDETKKFDVFWRTTDEQ